MADEPRYHFGPLEQHGLLFGLRLSQVVVLGAGLLLAFGSMGAAYPFQAERGLSSRGVFIGRDVHSECGFSYDP